MKKALILLSVLATVLTVPAVSSYAATTTTTQTKTTTVAPQDSGGIYPGTQP